MLVSKVGKLSPTQRFIYWVKERHSIYLKRQAGRPKPWTDDVVLQKNFFTNPYREHDKTTKWFADNIRDPLSMKPEVLMATVIFRWFNLISTGELLLKHNLLTKWNEAKAIKLLNKAWADGANPVFTGAYLIKADNGPRGCKIPGVCKAITRVWQDRKRLVKVCQDDCRLQALWKELKKFRYLGGFMAYEIVCDLRYTSLLQNATDTLDWCNIGPGARRGMNRILGNVDHLNGPIDKKVWAAKTADLLAKFATEAAIHGMPSPEMREVEHSLCEFDKFERVRTGVGGRSKRKYNAT
jgi:hypothetical protein